MAQARVDRRAVRRSSPAGGVARECETERKTVANFIGILEHLFLCFQVPVFTRRARCETAAHAKFYLFDAGVYRSLRPRGPLDRPEEIEGAALEGLVAQHLRAWPAYSGADATLYYWRTRSGVEVDFVLYGKDTFRAIEVKNTGRVRPEDLRGLKTFAGDYPRCEAILLYRGKESLRVEGIQCSPVEEFLGRMGTELARRKEIW